jgi:hypothetical protein
MWLDTLIEVLSRIEFTGPPRDQSFTNAPLLQPLFPMISLGFLHSYEDDCAISRCCRRRIPRHCDRASKSPQKTKGQTNA